MQAKYSINNYDKYICLKINDTLWIILLFLLRPYLVTLVSILNRKDKTAIINMVYADKMALWWGLVVGIPAALVIYASVRRKPGASAFSRALWHRGRELLAASAILNVAVVFVPVWTGAVYKVSIAGWAQLVVSLGIVATLYTSHYIRDCFSDYPTEVEDAGSS